MPVFHDHLEQGSAEWLAFRKDKISATDIAIIMGISPYCSPYQLWQRKLGLIPEVEENDAMRRGSDLEPIALKNYMDVKPLYMKPAIVTHSLYPKFMASLDGFDSINNRGVEIKCMGAKNHLKAVNGYIDPTHYMQMQWQMFCTGCQDWDYYCFDGKEGFLQNVLRDPILIDDMIIKSQEFLKMLETITPPPFTDLDYQDKCDDPDWDSLCDSYSKADDYEKAAKKQKDEIRKQLIEYSEGLNTKGTRSKFTKVITKGRVDFTKIPELQNIDLDPYRGEDTISYRLTMEKL